MHCFSFLCFSLVCSTGIQKLCLTAMPLSLILEKNKKKSPGSVKTTVLQKIYYIYLYIFYMNGMLNIQPKNQ